MKKFRRLATVVLTAAMSLMMAVSASAAFEQSALDGIVLIYKRLTVQGRYRWPRDKSEVRNLTWKEFDWLMSGIDIDQPKAIRPS